MAFTTDHHLDSYLQRVAAQRFALGSTAKRARIFVGSEIVTAFGCDDDDGDDDGSGRVMLSAYILPSCLFAWHARTLRTVQYAREQP